MTEPPKSWRKNLAAAEDRISESDNGAGGRLRSPDQALNAAAGRIRIALQDVTVEFLRVKGFPQERPYVLATLQKLLQMMYDGKDKVLAQNKALTQRVIDVLDQTSDWGHLGPKFSLRSDDVKDCFDVARRFADMVESVLAEH